MKKVVIVILIGVLLSLGLSSGALCARGGGHGGGGGHFGGGWHGGGYHGYYGGWRGGPWRGWYGFGPWWGYPYAYPYYYPYGYPYSTPYPNAYPSYPNAYAQPPVYTEPEQPSYWYYCQDPQGYYPYVTSCPGGWISVVPTPPPGSRPRPAPPSPKPTPAAVLQPIYFDLNKSVIRPDAAETLKRNLEWFRQNPDRKVRIQGNCDPRATESYNRALGQRRADAVKEYLVGLGVHARLLETMSYGKDRPSCEAKDEPCWARERRVDFEPMP